MKVSIFGYGSVGSKLQQLFSQAGHEVTLCGRETADGGIVSFAQGAKQGELIVLAVPYVGLNDLLPTVKQYLVGKVVVDATNPLNEDWSPLEITDSSGQASSAGEQVAKWLPESYVVKAFNTIFADVMAKESHDRGGHKITAFVAGDDVNAKQTLLTIVGDMGFAPLDVGALSAARYLEAMAHLNIQIAVGQGGGTNAAFVYHQGN